MIEKHENSARSEEHVLREYSDSSEEFDAEILNEYLTRYPEHADRLRSYASVWLASNFATPEEIAGEIISDQEMLALQSKLLLRLHSLKSLQEQTENVETIVERLNDIKGAKEFDRVTRIVLGDPESDEEELLIAEYLDPGLVKEPSWVQKRFGQVLGCLPKLVPVALIEYRGRMLHHYSANEKPVKSNPRNWADAVEALPVSIERKLALRSASLEDE